MNNSFKDQIFLLFVNKTEFTLNYTDLNEIVKYGFNSGFSVKLALNDMFCTVFKQF